MVCIRVSAVDHPELAHLYRILKPAGVSLEECIEERGVCAVDAQDSTPLQACIVMAKATAAPSVLLGSSVGEQALVAQWCQQAYAKISPALRSSPQPLSDSLGAVQEALRGSWSLAGVGAQPTLADWLVWLMVGGRIGALTPTLGKQNFWRCVRWGNWMRALSMEATGDGLAKAFDLMSLGSPEAGTSAKAGERAASGTRKSAPKDEAVEDVCRVEMKVGRIVGVVKHPNADRLYIERVDFGEDKERVVVSGLVGHFAVADLQDRLCCFVTNLKPASICKTLSQGMILVGKQSGEDGAEKLALLAPPAGSRPGDLLRFGLLGCSPDKELKQKVWAAVQAKITVSSGLVFFDGSSQLQTAGGPVTVDLGSGIVS